MIKARIGIRKILLKFFNNIFLRRNTIQIQNLFCGKCAVELKERLLHIKNISNVFVHQNQAHISFNYKKARDLSNLENMLTSLGFPPIGEKFYQLMKKVYSAKI